jgi:2-polyprenyl-3-methyl-5-hydroxy-6-metoxy-1,4-benzoquinol methylase
MKNPEKFWNRIAASFDNHSKKTRESHIKTIEVVREYLKKEDIVLDFGCATGAIALDVAGIVKEAYGVDISTNMIEIAKRKAENLKIKNVKFEQSLIYDERFKREYFDVIIAYNILHLVDDTQKTLQRLNDLLKPGGLIISSTACLGEKSFLGLFFIFLSKLRLVPQIRSFKVSELENLISEKFKIIKTNIYSNPPNYFNVARKR